MSSTDTVRPSDGNVSTIVRTYISAKKFEHLKYRFLYGMRLHLPEGVLMCTGWISGTQPVAAQRQALELILDAIALSGRNIEIHAVLRTEYLKQQLDFGRARNKKKKYRMHVNQLKTDEESFERTPILVDMHGARMRMADPNNDEEMHELALIEGALLEEAWRNLSKIKHLNESHPDLVL